MKKKNGHDFLPEKSIRRIQKESLMDGKGECLDGSRTEKGCTMNGREKRG